MGSHIINDLALYFKSFSSYFKLSFKNDILSCIITRLRNCPFLLILSNKDIIISLVFPEFNIDCCFFKFAFICMFSENHKLILLIGHFYTSTLNILYLCLFFS